MTTTLAPHHPLIDAQTLKPVSEDELKALRNLSGGVVTTLPDPLTFTDPFWGDVDILVRMFEPRVSPYSNTLSLDISVDFRTTRGRFACVQNKQMRGGFTGDGLFTGLGFQVTHLWSVDLGFHKPVTAAHSSRAYNAPDWHRVGQLRYFGSSRNGGMERLLTDTHMNDAITMLDREVPRLGAGFRVEVPQSLELASAPRVYQELRQAEKNLAEAQQKWLSLFSPVS